MKDRYVELASLYLERYRIESQKINLCDLRHNSSNKKHRKRMKKQIRSCSNKISKIDGKLIHLAAQIDCDEWGMR